MQLGDKISLRGVKTSCVHERRRPARFSAGSSTSWHHRHVMTTPPGETPRQPPFRRSSLVLLLVFLLAALLATDVGTPARSGEYMRKLGGAGSFTSVLRQDRMRTGTAAAIIQVADGPKRSEPLPDVFQGMMVPSFARESDCVPRDQIRRRLKLQGWWDFDALERAGDKFQLRARRPNGIAYQLTIDGCSGRVLGAMRLNTERGHRLWPR